MRGLGRALGPGRLYKQKRGRGPERWMLGYTGADGVRRRIALSTDKRVALQMQNEIMSQRDLELAGLGSVAGQSRPLAEVKELYLSELRTRVTHNHFRNVKERVERLLAAVRVQRVRDLQPHVVLAYRTRRLEGGASYRTMNHEVTNTKAMLTWAVKAGLIKESPLQSLALLSIRKSQIRRQRRAMSDEEIARFLRAAEEDDRVGDDRFSARRTIEHGTKGPGWAARIRKPRVPVAPMLRAFLETGARYGELTRVTWGDLDVDGRTLLLRAENTKSGRQRVIPMNGDLVDDLLALRPIHQQFQGRVPRADDRVFRTPRGHAWSPISKKALEIFWRILDRAGIERVDAQGRTLDIHALRHTFASRLARAGVPLQQVQRLLGHSDPKLTAQIYTHLETDDLRDAVERLGRASPGPRLVNSAFA